MKKEHLGWVASFWVEQHFMQRVLQFSSPLNFFLDDQSTSQHPMHIYEESVVCCYLCYRKIEQISL